jgi:hypothetical protein
VLLWAGVARWLDPVPWRVRLIHAAALLILFGPVLFTGRVLLPLGYLTKVPPFQELWTARDAPPPGNLLQSDLVLQITPWQIRVREALRAGEWPLWNHLAGAGEPLLGNPQAQVLQPLVWPALPFSAAVGAGITAALRVLVALTFTWLLLRRQGISEGPALAGSLAFGLGGGVLLWLGWPMANAPALLPVVLYAIARAHPALLAVAIFALLNAGHPETILHVSILAALFALSRLLGSARGERMRLLRTWTVAAAIGCGLAAPALLPAAHALPESLRAGLLAEQREQILRADPLAGWHTPRERAARVRQLGERLLPVAAPRAFGDSRFGAWWGESNTNEDGAGFVGTAVLLGALLALLAGGRRLPQERAVLGFTLAALVVLALPPGLAQGLSVIPVLQDSLTLHHRLLLTLSFCLAYLGACSWERWLRGEVSRPRAALALAITAALLAVAYLGWPAPATVTGTVLAVRRASALLQFGVLAAAGGLLLSRPERARRAALALAGIVSIELLAHHLPTNPPVPARLFYPEMPAIAFLRERMDPWHRIAGAGSPLRPNLATVYGFADPRTSNPAKPAAVVRALERINRFSGRATDGFVAPRDALYELLGVRYILTPPGQRLPRLRLVWGDLSVWIYEIPRPLPRLFLPHSTLTCPTGSSWSSCTTPIGNFRKRTALRASGSRGAGEDGAQLFEPEGRVREHRPQPAPRLPDAAWHAAMPRASQLNLLAIHPAWIRAHVTPAEPRLLASSLYQDGGWSLLVDGERRPTIHANGPFLAAWLGPGDRDLELIYRPEGFVLGMMIAAVALALGLALWVTPSPRDRGPSGTFFR